MGLTASILPRVIRFGAHNTRRNLPAASSSKRGESNFLVRFERAFFAQEIGPTGREFAAGREFSLDGYGRADVLWLAWRRTATADDFSAISLNKHIHLTAIEAKLKDWRKGLQQASRYRHFANRALLVLPPEAARIALGYIQTFRDLNVGLWEFDAVRGRIIKHTTPRVSQALNEKARDKAIRIIHRHLNLG
ncbi:MAG: hypothetical protein WC378_04610 [Opitutaceae bacterium]|jgi:hypothetical protein